MSVSPRFSAPLQQKTRVPELSRGVVCVILRLAVSVEHRLVTDGQTHDDIILALTSVARVKILVNS